MEEMRTFGFTVRVDTYGKGDLGDPDQFAEAMADLLEEHYANPEFAGLDIGKHPEWSIVVEWDEEQSW